MKKGLKIALAAIGAVASIGALAGGITALTRHLTKSEESSSTPETVEPSAKFSDERYLYAYNSYDKEEIHTLDLSLEFGEEAKYVQFWGTVESIEYSGITYDRGEDGLRYPDTGKVGINSDVVTVTWKENKTATELNLAMAVTNRDGTSTTQYFSIESYNKDLFSEFKFRDDPQNFLSATDVTKVYKLEYSDEWNYEDVDLHIDVVAGVERTFQVVNSAQTVANKVEGAKAGNVSVTFPALGNMECCFTKFNLYYKGILAKTYDIRYGNIGDSTLKMGLFNEMPPVVEVTPEQSYTFRVYTYWNSTNKDTHGFRIFDTSNSTAVNVTFLVDNNEDNPFYGQSISFGGKEYAMRWIDLTFPAGQVAFNRAMKWEIGKVNYSNWDVYDSGTLNFVCAG